MDDPDHILPGGVTNGEGQVVVGHVVRAENKAGQEVGRGVGKRRVNRKDVVASDLGLVAAEARRGLRTFPGDGGGSAAQDEALVDDLVDNLVPVESADLLGRGDDRLVGESAGNVLLVAGTTGELPIPFDGGLRGKERRREPTEISDGDGRRKGSSVRIAGVTYEGVVGVVDKAALDRQEDGLVLGLAELRTSGFVPFELVNYQRPKLAETDNSGERHVKRTLSLGPSAPVRSAGRLVSDPFVAVVDLEGSGLLLGGRELLVVVVVLLFGVDEHIYERRSGSELPVGRVRETHWQQARWTF